LIPVLIMADPKQKRDRPLWMPLLAKNAIARQVHQTSVNPPGTTKSGDYGSTEWNLIQRRVLRSARNAPKQRGSRERDQPHFFLPKTIADTVLTTNRCRASGQQGNKMTGQQLSLGKLPQNSRPSCTTRGILQTYIFFLE
jgi:hypothetical protein